ncbi:pigment biosynthesis protein Ayg1 [Venturia nashicola]|uniref:Pigment biosynthesis protein Ayg1 n=1 Tax=Venturia nashicola TaxID=86259 RepID=A0A4Z1P6I3_9PEZI|nr:pigment biosynthesis protein Ayg1 [Venturia nashicola]
MKGTKLWDVPIKEVVLPFKDAANGNKDSIPVYVRTPAAATKEKPVPIILLIIDLDGNRPDNSERTDDFTKRGWATVICDIPGVADCPSNKHDPLAPERLFTTILDYIESVPEFNARKLIA